MIETGEIFGLRNFHEGVGLRNFLGPSLSAPDAERLGLFFFPLLFGPSFSAPNAEILGPIFLNFFFGLSFFSSSVNIPFVWKSPPPQRWAAAASSRVALSWTQPPPQTARRYLEALRSYRCNGPTSHLSGNDHHHNDRQQHRLTQPCPGRSRRRKEQADTLKR